MPSFDTGSARSREEFSSARIIHDGPDRRKTERRDSYEAAVTDEPYPFISVVHQLVTGDRKQCWSLLDPSTGCSITGIAEREDLDFAVRYLKRHNLRITTTQSFYHWDQA
jgi:hypothetical protein